jgi:hypothetical protein
MSAVTRRREMREWPRKNTTQVRPFAAYWGCSLVTLVCIHPPALRPHLVMLLLLAFDYVWLGLAGSPFCSEVCGGDGIFCMGNDKLMVTSPSQYPRWAESHIHAPVLPTGPRKSSRRSPGGNHSSFRLHSYTHGGGGEAVHLPIQDTALWGLPPHLIITW